MDLKTISANSCPAKSDETEGENSHWISESSHRASRETYEGTECMITVVLDGGLAMKYSGIRLLIVYNPSQLTTEGLYHFRAIHDLRPFGISATDAWDEMIPQNGERRSNAPICSVILELYNDYIGGDAEHLQLRAIQISDLSDRTQYWRIAYDTSHTFKIDPASAGLVRFLHFDRSFLLRGVRDRRRLDSPYTDEGLFVWNYRVLPTSPKSRRALANLPSSVVRNIARQEVDTLHIDWPEQLLRLTTISRDWRVASDVILEFSDLIDTDYFMGLSRFLELFPEKARRIKKLKIEFPPRLADYSAALKRLVDASISVINWTTDLHSLKLSWSGEELHAILPAVRRLRSLEYVELIGEQPYEQPFQCPFSLIQSLIPESRNPLHLKVIMPARFITRDSLEATLYPREDHGSVREQTFLERSTWDVNLRTLELVSVMLTSIEMYRCIPPKSTSLTEVCFHSVFGVANQDLLKFMSAISHSLRRLYVVNCEFPTQKEDEELAIDATMQSMVPLEYAELSSCVATTLSILRKPARDNALDPEAPRLCKIFINNCNNKYRRIAQCNDTRFKKGMDMIVPALEATGWAVVGFGIPEYLPQEAKDVAERREIDLVDYTTWRRLYSAYRYSASSYPQYY